MVVGRFYTPSFPLPPSLLPFLTPVRIVLLAYYASPRLACWACALVPVPVLCVWSVLSCCVGVLDGLRVLATRWWVSYIGCLLIRSFVSCPEVQYVVVPRESEQRYD